LRTPPFLLVAALLALSSHAQAQSIEIKGLRIGMSKAEVDALFPSWQDFTIAGVRSADGLTPSARYHEEKLDAFHFFFRARDFDVVAEAVKEKYPATECVDSTVTNAMGATFRQTHCNITNDPSAVLRIARFARDVRTSALTLISVRSVKEGLEKRQERKKDI
jgi:hypothetical protein